MLYPTIWRRQSPNLWDELFNMRNTFDRMLSGSETQVGTGWCPAVDVHETKDELVLQAELPGLTKDDVELSIENGVLSVSGEKKQERQEGEEGSDYHLVERRYGRFERRFSLPRSVDPEKVKADFSNGMLNITLPKAEAAKPRRIPIKSNAK